MYTPKHFQLTDEQEAISFMQRYSFATIVTATDNVPFATHLPFLVSKRDNKIVLSSHFAKANPQATEIIGKDGLVIFTEPHAYISPKHYEKETNVPTWNYIAVHAYGKATILSEGEQTAGLLAQMISNYEADYLTQWNNLPDEYKQRMMKGIVAFEIIVDDLQGKQKLSQNRSETERENIINALGKSTDTTEAEIGKYMSLLK
ncbi:FMN-binding negative transcriptional regulator [Mucilaginibacter sp. NFR10]|jgi:transcriptional regulator|uniref:FMN-binding negative transcriptional regulator n=1 Tax=Mucilaginibacter sp. NFR10 TaxID=1566292 RepID=UPI0008717622|nr:FMN-binding negative transcriptional regulator [Mucilaginibacter sp. NFR10]SCW57345.1 negative transcriptional regulator, PaiB family [Mucilaginibacter sp. NFR10]